MIAFVILAILNASMEAKLYLYRLDPPQAQVASKAIKFSEVRLERMAAALPVTQIADVTFQSIPLSPFSLVPSPAFDLISAA